jgi:heme-degrading monooxygenase HmoA
MPSTRGNRGVYTLRRVADGQCEFLLLTLWDSWEAIKAFAGPDYGKAVYYPEDEKFLLSLEPHVTSEWRKLRNAGWGKPRL